MNRHAVFAAVLAAAALAACGNKGGSEEKKSGPAVARGEGITITAEEFKARLDEQSPFIRARFTSLERKKEFLDNLVRFELLANEAAKRGLDKDPEVQMMMKRVMVQKLVQRSFSDAEGAKQVPDAELQTYYSTHQDEYHRPAKVRLAHVLVKAPAAGPERAKKEAEAKKLLARLRAEEKKNPGAFAAIAREASEDEATKAAGGDLGFRTKEEVEKQLSAPIAAATFALADGQTSDLLASPQGFHLVKRTGWQDALDRPFESVKAQIANKLSKERRSKEFDEFVKKLKDDAKVKVEDAELEKIQVSTAGGPQGMPGMTNLPPNPAGPAVAPRAP